MTTLTSSTLRLFAVLLITIGLGAGSLGIANAQDATPVVSTEVTTEVPCYVPTGDIGSDTADLLTCATIDAIDRTIPDPTPSPTDALIQALIALLILILSGA